VVDRHLSFIGEEMRDGLGDWISRRHERGILKQGRAARNTLEDCGIPLAELRQEWETQRSAQLSFRARK
jgi:hypothetical protein